MRSWFRVGLIGAAAVAACKFNPNTAQQTGDGSGSSVIDAAIDARPIAPDAGPCMGSSIECADGDTLRVCTTVGGQATDTTCSWGCGTNGGTAHCEELSPTGGTAMASDTVGSDVGSATLPNNAMIHLDNGQIDPGIRGGGTGINSGIDFELRGGVAVFRFANLTMQGSVGFAGPQPQPPVVLVSTGSIVVSGAIDAQGGCAGGNGGPGGFPSTNQGKTPAGSGAGGGATDSTLGGGGGGYGAVGGSGGNTGGGSTTPAGGVAFGGDDIPVLIGGGGGGGGQGGNPFGGGGGGAIQLVANGSITIDRSPTPVLFGSINAGGCGGTSGTMGNASDTGGGGGAGGTILLEAHDIVIKGSLAVNGGGGGSTHANGMPGMLNGQNGALGRMAALGSTAGPPAGGNGGAGGSLVGGPGVSNDGLASAGGGSVGRIRFNTRAGSATIDVMAVLSPAPTDAPTTTCTQGVAATQ